MRKDNLYQIINDNYTYISMLSMTSALTDCHVWFTIHQCVLHGVVPTVWRRPKPARDHFGLWMYRKCSEGHFFWDYNTRTGVQCTSQVNLARGSPVTQKTVGHIWDASRSATPHVAALASWAAMRHAPTSQTNCSRLFSQLISSKTFKNFKSFTIFHNLSQSFTIFHNLRSEVLVLLFARQLWDDPVMSPWAQANSARWMTPS